MEPQFILKEGGLEKLGFSQDEFLELLEIDLKKVVSATEDLKCPKCKRGTEDTYFTFYKYRDYNFGLNEVIGKPGGYSFISTNYHLCLCGCLYASETESKNIVLKKNDKGDNKCQKSDL